METRTWKQERDVERMTDIEEERKPKKRRFRLRGKLIALVVLAAVLAGSFVLGAVWSHRGETTQITADLIGQQLREAAELVSVEYYYTNMGRFENQVDFYGWKVPFTTKSFIISYDGVIKAGVDLDRLDIQVTGNTITILLPPSRIIAHVIPEDSIEVFDETHNIFNPIEISDYTGFTADQRAAIEARAVENGLLTRATEQARATLSALLGLLPGIEDYTISYR